jgi:hypothetical protein
MIARLPTASDPSSISTLVTGLFGGHGSTGRKPRVISPMSSAPCARKRARTPSMSSTANMIRRMPSVFTGVSSGSLLTAAGMELVQLNSTVAVRCPQHGDLASNIFEPNEKVDVTALDWRIALQLHAELDKERLLRPRGHQPR